MRFSQGQPSVTTLKNPRQNPDSDVIHPCYATTRSILISPSNGTHQSPSAPCLGRLPTPCGGRNSQSVTEEQVFLSPVSPLTLREAAFRWMLRPAHTPLLSSFVEGRNLSPVVSTLSFWPARQKGDRRTITSTYHEGKQLTLSTSPPNPLACVRFIRKSI
ncbi:hypothetical protein P167DRAFT_547751 [Morchella conica CCBAS932]|uniref:Uncharacterized protein n=1 Tax=Morchella conica CCBAS932 TaxID=1392247 RepID=A0A3N4KGX8_9PEZI|nr:hypothetical protein P167DRAFT_547751 [Morchella conica CCBAS932]